MGRFSPLEISASRRIQPNPAANIPITTASAICPATLSYGCR